MNLLAVETATDACSVALLANGQTYSDHRIAPQQHARLLLPMIDQLLNSAGLRPCDLNAVVYGSGPGSFTGVRIAAAATQGIAFAHDIPTVGVSSLQAIAQGVYRETGAVNIIAMIDARMSEVYWGAYAMNNDGVMHSIGKDQVCRPNTVALADFDSSKKWVCAGSGADNYYEQIKGSALRTLELKRVVNQWPSAIDMLPIAKLRVAAGMAVPAAEAVPVYVRDKVALTEQERSDGQTL